MDGREFYNLRIQYGPQGAMAVALGISQSLVSMYERGYAKIPEHIAQSAVSLLDGNEKVERKNGRDVYEFRAKAGITQRQLAAAMGVSHVTVSNWETGGEAVKLSYRYDKILGDLDPTSDFIAEIPRYLYGCELSAEDQDIALFMVPNRYTGDNVPSRAEAVGRASWPEFADDREFLAGALFRVHRDGKIDRRQEHIILVPTWPTMPAWRETRLVVTLHVNHGYPRSKPNGSIRFRQRFDEELFKERAKRPAVAYAPAPRYVTPIPDQEKINAENKEIMARHLDDIRERQRIALGIKAMPAPQSPGIDLNDTPADAAPATESTAIIPLTHQN